MRELGECPFYKFRPCNPKCELYIEDTRHYTIVEKVEIVKGCAIRLQYEEAVNQTKKIHSMQAEVGETKNANLFLALSLLGDGRGQRELVKMINKKQKELDDVKKIQVSQVRIRRDETGTGSEDTAGSA